MSKPDIYVAIPAWGALYVDIAIKFTVPAILASIKAWDASCRPTFFIHTDQKTRFREALAGHRIRFFRIDRAPGHDGDWVAFKGAHREALAETPPGALLILLNSDIVVSIETVGVVVNALQGGKKIGVSVGIRTIIDGNTPPVGASAEAMMAYIWSHRHGITDNCILGTGRTGHPSVVFFPYDNGDVAMHCFHLTPMFVLKDRPLHFAGTIDDDLLEHYNDDAVVFFKDREFAVAECSIRAKTHSDTDKIMDAETVLRFAKECPVRPSHVRNFAQRYRVIGKPEANHPTVDVIMQGLDAAGLRPVEKTPC